MLLDKDLKFDFKIILKRFVKRFIKDLILSDFLESIKFEFYKTLGEGGGRVFKKLGQPYFFYKNSALSLIQIHII